jgi:glutaconate CoA-transferase, subunit A
MTGTTATPPAAWPSVPRSPLRRPPPVGRRVGELAHVADLVPDGATVGVGGTWLSSRPMAAIRQLIRAGRRNLRVVSLTGSLDVDLLVGSGAAESVTFCFVSLGPFGLAPRFRAAAEAGAIAVDDHTGHGLTTALEAAARGLDFLPFHGPLGTSYAARYGTVVSPSTSRPVESAAALPLDVALLHAEAATPDGHCLLAGTVGVDLVTARAADRVIVTTERLVDRLPQSGARYLTASEVDLVIPAPWGAHPVAHVPDYGLDWRALLDYADAAVTDEGFDAWLSADLAEDESARRERISPERARLLRLAGGGGSPQVPRPPVVRPATATASASATATASATEAERIVVELANRICDGDVAVLGSFTPIGYAAALLAQRLHAPRMDFIAYGFAASQVGWLGFLGVEGRAHATGYGPLRFEDLVGAMRFRGLIAFEPVRPAQVDGSGGLNLRRIDRPDAGHLRLPGAAGAPEVVEWHRRPMGYLPDHSPRTCVQQVDDVSLRAHPPHHQRDPFVLVTNLAVLELTREGWTVRNRHPGVSVTRLEEATGFPLHGAESAPETPEPPTGTLDLLRREIDPLGFAATETAGGTERRTMLAGLLQAEELLLGAAR